MDRTGVVAELGHISDQGSSICEDLTAAVVPVAAWLDLHGTAVLLYMVFEFGYA